MTKDLSDLSIKEIKKEISKIFLFPNSLEDLNKQGKGQFKLANLNEICIYEDNTLFEDEQIEKIKGNLSLNEIVKLYCFKDKYSGLVQTKISREPYSNIAGEIEIRFRTLETCKPILKDPLDNPVNKSTFIPLYVTSYECCIKGLPVIPK